MRYWHNFIAVGLFFISVPGCYFLHAQFVIPTNKHLIAMKTTWRKTYTDPNHLEIVEQPTPVPAKNQVRIKVHACSVNRTDTSVLNGSPYIFRFFVGWPKPRRAATGTDFAGVIDAVGSDIPHFKVGDRVLGFHDHGTGSHAEYTVVDASTPMIKLPNDIPFETAAAVTEGAHYAVGFLAHAKLKGDEHVLVYGVTGAIGSAMIQILQARGIACTGVYDSRYVSNAARAAAALSSLGVKHLIDAAHENFLAMQNRYDFVFDAVGKSRFAICKPLLKHGGCYLSSELGSGSENVWLSLAAPFMKKAKVRFPIPKKIEDSLEVIAELLTNGKLKPLIDRSYPLDDAAQAFTYVLSERKLGSVLLLP